VKRLVWTVGLLGLIAILIAIGAELLQPDSIDPVRAMPPDEASAVRTGPSMGVPDPEGPSSRALSNRGSALSSSTAGAESREAEGGEGPDGAAVSGRVLDVEGRPVSGAVLGITSDGTVVVTSDEHGSFRVEADRLRAGRLVVRSPELVLVCTGRHVEADGENLIVVVAPAGRLTGVVTYEDGRPAERTLVRFTVSLDALASFPMVFDEHDTYVSRGQTDEDGRFELQDVPSAFGLLEAYMSEELRAAKALRPAGEPVSLVLHAIEEPRAYEVSGIVVDAAGLRVPGATVRLGSAETTTILDGSFVLSLGWTDLSPELPLPDYAASYTLVASHGRASPAVITGFGARLEDPDARKGVLLRLGEEALAIEGRVLDAEGKPVEGLWITLADPTPMGNSSETVETLGKPWRDLHTDAGGRFRHEGLLDRSYRVCAVHEATGLVVESGPVPAGTRNLILRLPHSPWRQVRGVVRSRFGAPVPGVNVGVNRILSSEGMILQQVTSETVVTDMEGRFEIERAPRFDASLIVAGESIEQVISAIPDGDLDTEIELTVSLWLRFRLEIAATDGADRFGVLDEQGAALRVTRLNPYSRGMAQRWPLGGDVSSRVFEVADTAVQIVLYQNDEIVRRVPLALKPGEVTLVRG
jgi:protocatechuate 3,4-dioxygenase beta subunit